MQKDLSLAFQRKYIATIVNLNTIFLLTPKIYLRRRPEYGPRSNIYWDGEFPWLPERLVTGSFDVGWEAEVVSDWLLASARLACLRAYSSALWA